MEDKAFTVLELGFDKDIKSWLLELEVKDKEEFYNKILVCDKCHKKIDKDDIIYFCLKGEIFFHKPCCVQSKHHLRFQNFRNLEHEDYMVILSLKEKKNDK